MPDIYLIAFWADPKLYNSTGVKKWKSLGFIDISEHYH